MAGEKRRQIVVADAPALNMANRFSKYRPEEEKTTRKADVAENPVLDRFREIWKAFELDPEKTALDRYKTCVGLIGKMRYSVSDVEWASVVLAEFQGEPKFNEKFGMFLSALMNKGRDKDYVIRTAHLAETPCWIGFKNKTKNITIKGYAGDYCGSWMKGGTITVEGGAGAHCSYGMDGGSITVKGNVGDHCGHFMEDGMIAVNGNTGRECGAWMEKGMITVKGDAGDLCGNGMSGGEIHIEGEIGSIDDHIKHGKIFHKGKLILDK